MMDMFIIFDGVYDFILMAYTYVINISLYKLNICSLWQLCLKKLFLKVPKQNVMQFLQYKNITNVWYLSLKDYDVFITIDYIKYNMIK